MSLASHSVFTETILDEGKQWIFRDSIQFPADLGRIAKPNTAIKFGDEENDVIFGILPSHGCSHVASVEISYSDKSIKVTVYSLRHGFQRRWTITYYGTDEEFEDSELGRLLDSQKDRRGQISGGITEDGDSVLLLCRLAGYYSQTIAYIVRENGFTKRKPPSDTGESYSFQAGPLSDDSEYIFYTRSGAAFGNGGQALVAEAYSIRHLARARAVSFGFGNGRNLRNTQLLRPLRIQGSLYIKITTSSYDDHGEVASPMLIASSDGKLQANFNGLETIYSGVQASLTNFISPDDKHLFAVGRDDAMVKHWDLKHPTLNPLGQVRLPDVEYAKSRAWRIHGKETMVKDAIHEQIVCTRFSPGGKTFTIVTVNNSMVVINVLLTYNLQLVYNAPVQGPDWPGLLPLHVGFNDTTGLNIFGIFPAKITKTTNGLIYLHGVKGILISLPDLFNKVKSIENYFDYSHQQVKSLTVAVNSHEVSPMLRFRWQASVMTRNDADAMRLVVGSWPIATEIDKIRQRNFYDHVFARQGTSVAMESTHELRNFFVPHLLSFAYPWDPEQTVSVFGVIMKNEYYVIAIGPDPYKPGENNDVIRALSVSDIETGDVQQQVDIYKRGQNYIIHISRLGKNTGGYSGSPIPLPRFTIISPHFLEEDASYDTHIIHRAAHVTAPLGWIYTPNPALIETANFYAFFQSNTFLIQDQIVYGHRARSAYVVPKYLLWREYGLRALEKERQNDIFFGGGQYADRIGPYFRSIYEDKTYDDSFPLYPSTFALVCNIAYRSQRTLRIDAYFRRLHQERNLVLDNGRAISCGFPLACRARPIAALSFMRHLVAYSHRVNDIGAVEVKVGASDVKGTAYELWQVFQGLLSLPKAIWQISFVDEHLGPNATHVTLPLPGFCSFEQKLYHPPSVSERGHTDDSLWEFVRATLPVEDDLYSTSWERYVLASVQRSGNATASPFTRLVEEILNMKDRDIQLAFLKVVWLEKLLTWKMRTFGLWIYLTRKALPMLILCLSHLSIGILITDKRDEKKEIMRERKLLALVGIEAAITFYIFSVMLRQLYRIPRLFFKSLFNYMDGTALCLSGAMVIMAAAGVEPPRPFLGFSTLVIWIAAVLMLRIRRSIGMLLLLLTETLQGVFPFLVLLALILLGFSFVPYLLLRNLEDEGSDQNPFSSLPSTITQVMNFVASEYGALEPFETNSHAVTILRTIYIVAITILLLNMLVAMLNLRLRIADKNAENLYYLQMASLVVEIELGLLSSSERKRHDWFPVWFSYSMTETEKRSWNDYIEKNPLKWTIENSATEDKDHKPVPQTAVAQTTTESKEAVQAAKDTNKDNHRDPKTAEDLEEDWEDEDSEQEQPSQFDNIAESKHSLTLPSPQNRLSSSQTPTAEPSSSVSNGVGSSKLNSSKTDNAAQTIYLCHVCEKPGTLCTGCRKVAYCGREHQKQDWKSHKGDCKGKGKESE